LCGLRHGLAYTLVKKLCQAFFFALMFCEKNRKLAENFAPADRLKTGKKIEKSRPSVLI